MGAKKNNISQIDKYLRGQLDAKAMHQMERQAQDDPFLMDALEGFEKAGADQSGNLADLQARLTHRVAKNKTRSILRWRVLPIAACLLLMLGGGYWFISRPADKVQYADHIRVESKPKAMETEVPPALKETPEVVAHNKTPQKEPRAGVVAKTDTVKYTASNIRITENLTVDELVKRMEGMEVNTTGTLTKQGDRVITSVKLNDKDYGGGNVNEALKKLPADIRDKIQVIDDSVDLIKAKPYANSYGSAKVLNEANIKTADRVIVSGTLLDAVTKEPLIGATIGTQKDGKIAQADTNGNYQIAVEKGSVLTFSYVGYKSESHKLLPNEGNVNINLTTDDKAASEVVIRGYVKRNGDIAAGNPNIIIGKEVKDYPVGNVEQLLQGKVAGLNIQNNTGAPGMRGSVNIRGLNTATDSSHQTTVTLNKDTTKNCNENIEFKKRFENNILIVESYVFNTLTGRHDTVKPEAFNAALKFISRYTKVSIGTNANARYKDVDAFMSDKAKWLNWYETNKCKGLK